MESYETVTEALSDLKRRGFTTDFNLAFDNIKCRETGVCLSPAEFEITEHYRFEGDTNPSDEEVVYAITSKDGKIRGTMVNAFGIYSEQIEDALMRKLQVHR